MDGHNAAVQVGLPCHLGEARDSHDGAAWPVLGHQVSWAARGGDDDDSRGHGLERGFNRCYGCGVGGVCGQGRLGGEGEEEKEKKGED